MSAVAWTDERIATLQRLWADGRSATEISYALGGVSRNAVLGKLHRLKLPARENVAPRVAAPKVKPLVGSSQFAKGKPDPAKMAEVKKIENRPAPADMPKPLLVKLFDLESSDCRWPVSGEKADMLFCGHNVEPGCPYCPGHKRMSIGRGTESERTALKSLLKVA